MNLENWWEDTKDSTFGVQYKLEAEKDEARIEELINYMQFCFILKSWRNHWRILYQKQCSQIYVFGKSLWEKCEEWDWESIGLEWREAVRKVLQYSRKGIMRGWRGIFDGGIFRKKEGMVNRAKVAKRASEKDWSSFSIILLITGNQLMYLLVCYLFPLPGCL